MKLWLLIDGYGLNPNPQKNLNYCNLISSCEIVKNNLGTHLPKQNVPHSRVNVLLDRLTRGNHVAILKLHRLGTLSPKLSAYYNLRKDIASIIR